MTSPHFRIKIISRKPKTKTQVKRGKGQSAVACAAYRSGQRLHDRRNEKTFDYRRKGREQVKHIEISAPDGALDWTRNRESLWNKVEFSERKSNAQLAREITAGLPREITLEKNIQLTREFVNENFTDKGMIADWAIHESRASDGGTNPHVHIMLTTRNIEGEGFSKHKNRKWNDRGLAEAWRGSWEDITNKYLEQADSSERVSLQSYETRGINKQPGIHMGYEAWALEKDGISTRFGKHNFKVGHFNQVRQAVDSLGLGNDDKKTALAEAQKSLARDRQSALPRQHHDQPLEPHQRQHFTAVRKAVEGINFDQFNDPVKLANYLQEYNAREEAAQLEAANDNKAEQEKKTETEKFWADFLKQQGKDSGQEGHDDELGR